jgi:hypothetical protein
LIDILKEKQEAEEKQSKSTNEDMNSGKMMRDASRNMPSTKAPSMPSMPRMGNIANFPGIPSSLKI